MSRFGERSDSELMEEIAHEGEDAFEELILRHQDNLFSYFRRSGAGAHDAEDLAQETFIKIYRHASTYTPSARFTTFLFTVARNTWIDFLRKNRRYNGTVELTELTQGIRNNEVASDSPEQAAYMEEARMALTRTLEQLPEKQRQALLLAETQGLKYQEIAQILEIPLGTVKSRIFNAVKFLREGLSELGFISPHR